MKHDFCACGGTLRGRMVYHHKMGCEDLSPPTLPRTLVFAWVRLAIGLLLLGCVAAAFGWL